MGPTWVLSAPGGSHIGPMNLVLRDRTQALVCIICIEHTFLAPTYQLINEWVTIIVVIYFISAHCIPLPNL